MKFKVGDRIRFIGRHKYIPSEAYGEYGTIHLVDKYDTAVPYHVKLDKKINGECYYWATEEHLEAINDPEEKGKLNIETKQIFATRTKTLRKERGLSQTELAAALGISRTIVNLYESASRVPDITALARYASFFSVTSDYLLGLSENRAIPEELKDGWGIVISSDGDDTIAKLYEDGSLAQVDVVSRYYKDEYSMETAAKEAVKKLFEPHRFTGKAMFVGDPDKYWGGLTYGKIYCFIDGICVDDNGNKRCATTLEPDGWGYGDFIKVVE